MAFRRRSDSERAQSAGPSLKEHSPGWYLKEKYAKRAKVAASFCFLVILVLVVVYDFRLTVRESVVENLIQVSAGLSAFCLALPLFLKVFQSRQTFWKSFLLLLPSHCINCGFCCRRITA